MALRKSCGHIHWAHTHQLETIVSRAANHLSRVMTDVVYSHLKKHNFCEKEKNLKEQEIGVMAIISCMWGGFTGTFMARFVKL